MPRVFGEQVNHLKKKWNTFSIVFDTVVKSPGGQKFIDVTFGNRVSFPEPERNPQIY